MVKAPCAARTRPSPVLSWGDVALCAKPLATPQLPGDSANHRAPPSPLHPICRKVLCETPSEWSADDIFEVQVVSPFLICSATQAGEVSKSRRQNSYPVLPIWKQASSSQVPTIALWPSRPQIHRQGCAFWWGYRVNRSVGHPSLKSVVYPLRPIIHPLARTLPRASPRSITLLRCT